MDKILIEVNDAAARNWRNATDDKKALIATTIEKLINNSLGKKEEDFWEFTDKLAKKAEANGLTEDILKDILDE